MKEDEYITISMKEIIEQLTDEDLLSLIGDIISELRLRQEDRELDD